MAIHKVRDELNFKQSELVAIAALKQFYFTLTTVTLNKMVAVVMSKFVVEKNYLKAVHVLNNPEYIKQKKNMYAVLRIVIDDAEKIFEKQWEKIQQGLPANLPKDSKNNKT